MERSKKIFIILAAVMLISSVTFSQTKLAQTGFNFLGVSSDARSSGMGDAVNSVTGFSGALFHNPASMTDMPTFFNTSFNMNTWIADIKYLAFSMTLTPFSADYGVLGLSFQSVDYGEVEGTIRDGSNPNGYIDTKVMEPTAFAIGLGYAKKLNEQFSVGAQIKYASQTLGESTLLDGTDATTKTNKANVLAFDFGTVYKTGIKSLAFGMSVRNYSNEVKFEEEGFQLPLLFTLGVSANLFDFLPVDSEIHDVLLSIDATHPRSHPEQVKFGLEYKFMDILSLRGGYVTGNDEDDITFGLGLSSFGLEVDYSYTPFGVFDNVQRFTARFSL